MAVDKPIPRARKVPLSELVSLLAPTLGQEKAAEVVERATEELAVGSGPFDRREADMIVDKLAGAPSIVGIAARIVRKRASFTDEPAPQSPVPPSAASGPPSNSPDKRADIVNLLANGIGKEKSREVVEAACKKLGVTSLGDARTVNRVLEELATMPGQVGVTARFAKARFALRK
ncbi:MAG: hypothetical protein IPK82_33195 [Polyangiaceae bacterium]|nr:hypothetical protein [Polyangiaceae bacterium]